MTVLSDVIAVTVNVNTLNPQFPGFGIPLIVGKFSPSIAQVMSITVNNAVQGDTYVAIVNGNTYTYTGDSTTTVTHYALGLGALITAGEPSLTLSYLVGVITVTANTPGNPFTCISGTETGSITVASVTTNYAGPLGVNRYAQFTSMAAVATVFPQTSVAGVDAVAAATLTLAAGDLSIQNGTSGVQAITGTFTSADQLVSAINSSVPGVNASVNSTTGMLELKSAEDITLAGARTGAGGLQFASLTNAATGNLASGTVLTVSAANDMIQRVDSALTTISNLRSTFGAMQNRFESVIASLGSTSENLTASRSRIQDTDFAAETASLTRAQILQQAGTAMLAQANSLPNTVLSLLKG